MPYAYGADDESMATWKKVALIGALVICVPLLLLFATGVYMGVTQTPEQRFDRQVAAIPQVSSFALPLKKHFPEEYDRLRRSALGAEKGGIGAVGAASEAFFAGFMKRHSEQAKKASDEKLAAYLAALGKAYGLAEKDGKTCMALIAGQSQAVVMANNENMSAFGQVAATYIEAAASGRDRPVPRGAVSDADKLKVQAAMRSHGFTPEDMVSVGNRTGFAADPARPCKLMTAMVSVISTMPPEQRARLTALFAEQT